MKSILFAAVATFAIGGPALAAATTATHATYGGGAMKATPVVAETCATAKAKYDEAVKDHAASKALGQAEMKAKTAAADCANGRAATGIADYQAAIALLK